MLRCVCKLIFSDTVSESSLGSRVGTFPLMSRFFARKIPSTLSGVQFSTASVIFVKNVEKQAKKERRLSKPLTNRRFCYKLIECIIVEECALLLFSEKEYRMIVPHLQKKIKNFFIGIFFLPN